MNEDIRRSVRTRRHDRSAGDAPNMGRVSRMPGTGLPKGKRRRKRKAEGARHNRVHDGKRKIIKTWTRLLAVAALALLGTAIWLGINKRFLERPEIVADEALQTKGTRVVSKFAAPSERAAIELVKTAMAVRDPAQVGQPIRSGKSSPEQVVEFLKGMVTGDGEIDTCEWLGNMDANGMALEGVKVSFKADGRPHNRLAMLTPDTSGKWQLDFGAFARSVQPSWKEIIEGRAPVAMVRVYVAVDSYYNGIFSDDKVWVCFGLASPDTPEILIGYCKRDSPQARGLRWIASKNQQLNRATLELHHPEGAGSRQFQISKVLAEDWVLGEKPFDQDF